jgi:hypothetical protein
LGRQIGVRSAAARAVDATRSVEELVPALKQHQGVRCLTAIRKSRIFIPVEFIEAPFFTRVLPAYLGADDYREL